MTERGRSALQRSANALSIGPSDLTFDGETLTFRLDETSTPWLSPLRGIVRITPASFTNRTFRLDAEGLHRWSPLAPLARVEVALDAPHVRWTGHGYLDTNDGDVPLESSFRKWDWARAVTRGGARILYDVSPLNGGQRSLALRIDADGTLTETEPPPLVALPKTRWRVARTTRADAGMSARVTATLEDAPFYARSLLATHLDGEPVTAVHESLSLTRFDKRWIQMLLPFRMPRRTVYARGDGSSSGGGATAAGA